APTAMTEARETACSAFPAWSVPCGRISATRLDAVGSVAAASNDEAKTQATIANEWSDATRATAAIVISARPASTRARIAKRPKRSRTMLLTRLPVIDAVRRATRIALTPSVECECAKIQV